MVRENCAETVALCINRTLCDENTNIPILAGLVHLQGGGCDALKGMPL